MLPFLLLGLVYTVNHLSFKCQRTAKNIDHNFTEPMVTF